MKKRTSLVSSLIAIVICFSMLLGTTYAWFTDSIVNTNNIIKSGNVDVELYHKSNSDTDYSEVDGTTKLFVNAENGGEILWEVGSTATETFKIANAGSLSLKYDFRIKAVSKTVNANKKSLADVLTLEVKKVKENGFEEIYNDVFYNGTTNGTSVGASLAPNDYDEYVVTIHFAEEQEGVIYNDFQGLKLLLGIELVATQVNSEFDGTGNKFDESAQFPNVSSNANLVQGKEAVLETKGENAVSAKLPSELVDELKSKGFDSVSLVHTDPIVENDKITFESIEIVDKDGNVIDLSANDKPIKVTLPAQETFGEDTPVSIYHDGKEVATATVGANGVISYEVKHLCKVSIEFNGIKDNTELDAAIKAGETKLFLVSGNYIIPDSAQGKTLTFIGNGETVIATQDDGSYEGCDYSLDGSTVTFKNVTINTDSKTYTGYARLKSTYENCIINGTYTLYGNSTFNGCTFNVSGDVYNVWTWGAPEVTFSSCTFNSDGKAVLLYGTANTKLTVNNCTFNDNGGLTDLKAAIEIGNDYSKSYELIVNNTTVNGYAINDKGISTGTTLWANKNSMGTDKLNVVVDGEDVY